MNTYFSTFKDILSDIDIIKFIVEIREKKYTIKLNFICTHDIELINMRKSELISYNHQSKRRKTQGNYEDKVLINETKSKYIYDTYNLYNYLYKIKIINNKYKRDYISINYLNELCHVHIFNISAFVYYPINMLDPYSFIEGWINYNKIRGTYMKSIFVANESINYKLLWNMCDLVEKSLKTNCNIYILYLIIRKYYKCLLNYNIKDNIYDVNYINYHTGKEFSKKIFNHKLQRRMNYYNIINYIICGAI
jgi:hypothetical protein